MRAVALLAAAMFAAVPASADDFGDVLNTLDQFQAAYKNGDLEAWTGFCTADTVVIDGVAPFVFLGPDACAKWWQAQITVNKKNGWSETAFVHAEPIDYQFEGDRFYIAVMTKFTYQVDGHDGALPGLWTLTFRKSKSGWRVTSWTWAG